ncbi:NAD-dependent epimerase/dehydratase family protein [Ectothiorhodospiraceae bacterium WFHF3C12]|nr:NAD-dependent epimerase/dehydratase family protein [Ectothiorhodospiraceae bacterium WFHF3C12]
MRILVTGAGGFIGSNLVGALLEAGGLEQPDGRWEPLTELVLVDWTAFAEPDAPAGVTLVTRQGDICDPAVRQAVFERPVDVIFHLAATLTAEAQADPVKATRVNVRGFLDLLDACRSLHAPPRFVFASSIATYGGDLPETVDDGVVQTPQTSYGAHKVIAEQLINDYTRHGVIDGRALRLPIVLVREPGRAPSVSDQVAAIVREPLAGRDTICPFRADTCLTVASVQHVAHSLLKVAALPAGAFGATRAMNLPALTTTPAKMIAAVNAIGKDRGLGTVSYELDEAAQAVVDGWPRRFVSERATRAGLRSEDAFESIVEAYIAAGA